jgi:hypothetical protein
MPNRFSSVNSAMYRRRWLALVAAAGALGCAGHDEMLTGEVEEGGGEPVSAEAAAYSDQECQAAHADVRNVSFTLLSPYVNTSPATYSNSKAYKSYIWDVNVGSVVSEVYTVASLATSRFSPMVYDTQAECEGLSFNRRLYTRPPGGGALSMYAEGFSHGKWDADFGCVLPRFYGPDLLCGNSLPCQAPSSGTTIRVCVSARDSGNNTIPVTVSMGATAGIRSETFVNPQVRVGSTWVPVQDDATSALAYCIKRDDVSVSFKTPSATAVWPFAFFNSTLHTWRLPVGTSPGTVIGSIDCYPQIRPML